MLNVNIQGIELKLNTKPSLFSPNFPDAGTLAMLSAIKFSDNEKLLDLGCGYGLVGIYAAKIIGAKNITMLDVDPAAVETARQNAELNGVPEISAFISDGFKNLDETGFTLILSNPPYHTDFNVAKHFIEKGFNRLALGGKMMMVTKRREWYKNKLISVFGGVSVTETDGYYIFCSEKRSLRYADAKPNKRKDGVYNEKANPAVVRGNN